MGFNPIIIGIVSDFHTFVFWYDYCLWYWGSGFKLLSYSACGVYFNMDYDICLLL